MQEKDFKKGDGDFFYDKYGRLADQGLLSRFLFSGRFKISVSILVLTFFIFYWMFVSAPVDFPEGKVLTIKNGVSVSEAGEFLQKEGVLRSPTLFRILIGFFDGKSGVKAGKYVFENKENVLTISRRLAKGERGFPMIKVVIPEGTSVKEISEIISTKISDFDSERFLQLALPQEGYLFPESYSFNSDVTPEVALSAFLDSFRKKTNLVLSEIENFGRPIDDVVKMASIVEEEGRTFETRQRIAGILWKRLDIGMPLQVDAAFKYSNGKTTFELTTEDLMKDGPYNTYTRRGLPPTPITNPGLDSILATIRPIKSQYLFYLTDNDGVMRYAKTHDEHVANKIKYLR